MYDPGTGRFTTQDPIGFRGGDTNLYRYCHNSPTNATDPSGLTTLGLSTLIGTVGGAVIGFAAGGMSGEGATWYDPSSWTMDRALAGAGSGAMIGAGLGLLVDTWGASTPLSVGLVGAGIGAGIGSAAGGGLLSGRGSVNWSGYGQGAAVGGLSGFAGGYVGAAVAPFFGGGLVGGAAAGFTGGVAGDVAGQGLGMGMGWRDHYDPVQTLFSGAFGAVLGGATGYLSKTFSGLVDPNRLMTVSRWGSSGLQSGDWVMRGSANRFNYLLSFKWENTRWNQAAPFSSGQNFEVPIGSVRFPLGWEWIKFIFNQRVYKT